MEPFTFGGTKLDLVLRKEDEHEEIWRDQRSGRCIRVVAPFDLPAFCTVYQAELAMHGSDPILIVDQAEQVFSHEKKGRLTPLVVVELCAGTGSMSEGPRLLGANVVAAIDWNKMSIEHLARGDRHGELMMADVSNSHAIHHLHKVIRENGVTILAGLPCQPFSAQGYHRGEHDERYGTFFALLDAMFLLQPQAAILECAPQFASNATAQQKLQQFLQLMQWKEHSVVLDLKDQWVMKRERHWNLLVPSHFPIEGIPVWPLTETPHIVGEVLPVWGKWNDHEEHQLSLTVEELAAFTNPQHGRDKRVFTSRDTAPTVLHSCSVTHSPCPCGCRANAFSPQALVSKGLRGFWVQSRSTGQSRYLHPLELQVLLSILPEDNYDQANLRGTNCLLGLAAAPLQATWIFAHLLKAAAKQDATCAFIAPEAALAAHKSELRRRAANVFGVDLDPIADIHISVAPDSTIHLLAPHSATVGHFLDAERFTLEWGEGQYLCEGSFNIPPELPLLPSLPLDSCLIRKVKRQRTCPPVGSIIIGIVHQGACLIEIIEAGQFLF